MRWVANDFALENRYVIYEWMRADSQMVKVEQRLKQRRQRGFWEGGPRSEASGAPAAVDSVAGSGEVQQQMLQVLGSLDWSKPGKNGSPPAKLPRYDK